MISSTLNNHRIEYRKVKTLCSSTFHLTTVSYEAHAIKYVWKNDEDTLRKSPSLTTLNAYLTKNSTDNCEEKGNWRGKGL